MWYAVVMVVETKAFFIFSKFVTTLRTCEEVDDTMDGKDNREEKTREGVDIRMYHFSLNFLQLGCDMLW
jgi:hypothetical protein